MQKRLVLYPNFGVLAAFFLLLGVLVPLVVALTSREVRLACRRSGELIKCAGTDRSWVHSEKFAAEVQTPESVEVCTAQIGREKRRYLAVRQRNGPAVYLTTPLDVSSDDMDVDAIAMEKWMRKSSKKVFKMSYGSLGPNIETAFASFWGWVGYFAFCTRVVFVAQGATLSVRRRLWPLPSKTVTVDMNQVSRLQLFPQRRGPGLKLALTNSDAIYIADSRLSHARSIRKIERFLQNARC